ncbi:unnamed protein product [Penicillium discolor]
MNPETLAHALLAVLAPIAEERRPGEPFDLSAADIVLERPRNRDHGDWASNIAMRLAKTFGTNPRELAQQIADGLADVDGIASVEVAGPGFLNIRLDAAAAGALAKVIVDAGPAYGTNSSQEGARPDLLDLPEEEQLAVARELGYEYQLAEIKHSLERFNVPFDVWFSERTLHAKDASGSSLIDQAVDRLREQGHVFDEDGAVWVRTTDFGDDKDRGDRGFRDKIYLLGADHHGYVHRLKAVAGAAGDDPAKNIQVLIGQMVSINGARLSKRAGNIIEMDDLLDWLGTDALRYSLERSPADSPLDLDPELLQKRTNDNPVFYVQYAHARTHNVARNAADSGIDRSVFAPETLTHQTEAALLGALQEFPRIVAFAAEVREPHRVARYLEELAGLYHRWYDNCRVIPLSDAPVEDVHRTRLWLNDAAGQVFRNGLDLLGVSAPERM